MTPNQDWIISPHPTCPGLYIAGGGSFHSWKFLPTIGKYVTRMLKGELTSEEREKWAWDLLYLSPIADILVSQFPSFGIEWERTLSGVWWGRKSVAWQFYPLLHCALYAVIVLALAAINRRLAGRVLLRSKIRPTPALPAGWMPQLAQE